MENANTMTESQINLEIVKTKTIMDNLMNCIKDGKTEYYKDYLQVSTYYLKLNQVKPSHNLKAI